MDDSYYDGLDGDIRGVLVEIHALTPDQSGEIEEYLDAGEYGLALETLVDILVEERVEVPGDVVARIRAVAETMGTADEVGPRLSDLTTTDPA